MPTGRIPSLSGKPVRCSLADCSTWEADMLWIGRAMPERNMAESLWANPFRIGNDRNRQQVIQLFRDHFHKARLDRHLHDLAGKVLVCACRRGQQCHGDVLITEWNRKCEEQADILTNLKRVRGDGEDFQDRPGMRIRSVPGPAHHLPPRTMPPSRPLRGSSCGSVKAPRMQLHPKQKAALRHDGPNLQQFSHRALAPPPTGGPSGPGTAVDSNLAKQPPGEANPDGAQGRAMARRP